ncbi:hypothetical protein HGO75_24785, partial [Mycobacterium tuberculosis]|nr:hypothetical protein [Mycobacterium tuberculosis]
SAAHDVGRRRRGDSSGVAAPGVAAASGGRRRRHVETAAGVQARLRELTSKVLPMTLAGGAAVTALALLRRASLRQAVADGVA